MHSSTSAAKFLSGLDDRPATLDEIARRLGVSMRSVRRIHAWARVGAADKFIEEPGRRGKFATFRLAPGVNTPTATDEGHLDRIPVAALKPLPRTPADDARDAMFAACRRRMAKERERLASLRRERLRKSETWRIA